MPYSWVHFGFGHTDVIEANFNSKMPLRVYKTLEISSLQQKLTRTDMNGIFSLYLYCARCSLGSASRSFGFLKFDFSDLLDSQNHPLLYQAGGTWRVCLLKVNQEEADEVHKMLEEFHDEVNEEKVLRRLKKKGTASEGSVQRSFAHWASIALETVERGGKLSGTETTFAVLVGACQ